MQMANEYVIEVTMSDLVLDHLHLSSLTTIDKETLLIKYYKLAGRVLVCGWYCRPTAEDSYLKIIHSFRIAISKYKKIPA